MLCIVPGFLSCCTSVADKAIKKGQSTFDTRRLGRCISASVAFAYLVFDQYFQCSFIISATLRTVQTTQEFSEMFCLLQRTEGAKLVLSIDI